MIERLERTKVLLYQESLTSIAADGIALPALLLLASQAAARCLHVMMRMVY
jgi:hypothetical protein